MANRMSSAEAYARLVKDEREAYAFVEKEYGSTEPMSARQQLNALNLLGKDYNRIVAAGSWRDRDTMRDLRTRVLTAQGRTNDLREYYERNQYRMNSTDYLRAMGELDQLDSMISQMSAGVNAASDMYAPYNNADEYKVNLGYATKYYGMSGADVDTEIERLTNTGRTSRRATDEEVGEIAADLDKRWRQAESNVRDIEGMMQGRLSDEMRQYYNADTLAAAQRELDAIENERESFYTTLADKGGWMIDEVNSENQQAIDWLNDYRGVADYAYGTRRYGYDPAAMKPYEVLDITAKSDEEQAWLDDYVQMAATNGGYIGTEDWRQAAEAQRAYDSIGGTNREAILDLADSYYGWQQLVGTEAAQAQEQRFWRKAEEVAQATGMTPQELLTQVESIYPYVAQMGMEKFRAQVQAEASAHPWITTGLTYVIQPVANLQSSAYLLGSEIFGGTPSAANPAMTAYTYNTATRGQVGADINKYFVDKYGEERGGRYGDTAEWVYNAVNSTVDSAVNMLITNGVLSAAGGALNETGRWVMQNTVSNLVMGSGAASQRFIELKQQGYDDFAAVAGAAGSGLIEGLTEAIGGERLLKAMQTYGVGFLEVLKQGLSEGIEERFANELNGLVDWLYQDDGGESIIRKIVGLVAGYKAAGYDTDEAMRIAFSEATRENWSAFLAGMFSGGLHMAAGGIGQSISRTAGEYSYARAARNSTQELSSINALSQQLNETDKLNLPQLAKSDNIFKVMRTVRSAAEQSNYNATKEATREMGIEVRRQVGENNETVSNELVSAITKRTVSDAITAVRQLSKEEARLLSLTANEEKLLNSRKVRKFIEQLDAKSAEDKKDNEDGLSYSQRNRIKALEFMRANGYEGQLDNIKAADTAKALELVTKAQRVGSTFNGAKPALDTILKETPAAYQGIVTRAFNSGAESQQTAVVNDAGNIELKGVSAAGLAFINQQHRNILDEDSRAEFHENVAGAYFAGQYYGETQYAKQLMEEMYKEHGDIKAELKAVYEASVAERNEKGETARPTTMKRGEVRNISAEEAAANGVSTVDVSKLTQQQKEEAKVVRSLAKQMGFSVVFFDSAGGAVEGWHQGGTIYLDANAGYVNDRSMLRTMSHELTHFIQQYNRSAYNELRDFIVETYHESREEFENRLEQLMASQQISEERALDELIARGCEMMLKDSKAPQLLYERNADLYGKIAARIREWAQAIRNAIRKLMGDVKPHSAEAKRLMAVEAFANEVQQLWDEGLVGAVENMQSGLTPGVEGTVYDKNGAPVAHSTDNGTIQLSIRTYEEEGRAELQKYLKKSVSSKRLTKAESEEMMAGIEEIYKVCKEFKDKYAPFSTWSEAEVVYDTYGKPVFSVVTPNGEYKMNLDFSLVCKKRRTLDAVFNEMAQRGIIDDFELGQKSVVKINELIRKYGFETACALCFVDAKRFRQASMADSFVRLYNELVYSLVPENQRSKINYHNFSNYKTIKPIAGGIETWDNSQLDFTHLDEVMKNYAEGTVEYKAAKYIKANAKGRKLLLRGDFMSSAGFDAVKTQNADILKLYNSKKGTGGPKAAFGDVQYLNEVIKKARSWTAKKAYAVGGIRIQSFSDYVPRMVFDYVQMVYDLAATKLPAHAYTKEELFAKQFGLTGIKINMSLIPAIAEGGIAPGLDANGNYVWAGESFDFETAKQIQDAEGYTENCGTICVGVSYAHIVKLLSDGDIRMVIPYHKSGLNPVVAHMNKIAAFTDYTTLKTNPGGCQNTIDRKTGSKVENDFKFNEELRKLGDPKAVAKKYLEWCAANDYMPRFAEFAWHENYYKLIEDFTLYDKDGNFVPQRGVKAVFPKADSAFGSMKDLIEAGLKEDAIIEGRRNARLSKIVDEIERTLPKTEAEIENVEVKQADRDLEAVRQYAIRYPSYTQEDLYNNALRLQQMDVVTEVAGDEIGDRSIPLKQRITSYFNSLANNVYSEQFGDVALVNSSVRSEMRHGHTPPKIEVYAAVPDVIKKGVVIWSIKKNNKGLERIIVAAPVGVGTAKEKMYVGVMLQRDPQNQRLYLHDVVTEKEFINISGEHLIPTGPIADEDKLFTTTILLNALKVKQKSIRDEADMVATEAVSNAELRDIVAQQQELIAELRAEMKPHVGHKVSRPAVRKIARDVRLRYGSLVNVDELTDKLEAAYNTISDSNEPSWTEYNDLIVEAATMIVDNDRELRELSEEARMVLDMVKATPISLNDAQKAELNYVHDGYNGWRKSHMGRIKISNTGTPLDIQWQEWSAQYPLLFPTETTSAEQAVVLGAVVDSMRRNYGTQYGYDRGMAIEELTADLMDAYFDVPEALTYADKMQNRIDAVRNSYKEKVAAVRAEYKARYEAENRRLSKENRKLAKESARVALKLAEEQKKREEWRRREAEARKRGNEKLRDYRQKRNESDAVNKYRSRVESSIKSLLDLMVTNTDKKHIPEALKEPIANFIEALDLTSERMREGGKPTKRDIDYNQRLNALRAAMATYTANAAKGEADGYLDLPDGFVEMLNTSFDTPVYDMSAAELRLLDRALTILKTAVSQSNELMVNKNYARVSEAGEATIADLDELGAAKDLGWLKGINKLFLWNNATPYYAFRRLGSAGAAMFESLQSGWDKLALNAQRVVKDSEQMYTAQEAREWGETVLDIGLSNERVVKMTAAQAMSVYCLAKRQQGLGHLLGGGIKISVIDAGKGKQIAQYDNYTLTIEDLQAITAVLSERQRQVADKLQDYMGTVGAEWGNEVSMKRFGYRAFGEANYFPITSDPNNLNSLNTDAKSSDMFRLLNLSATKSLVKGANNAVVISNVFDVFAAHMADMAKYNALALPILDMVKWYNYKRREEVKSASGKNSETTHIVTATIQKSLEKAFGVDQGGKSYAAEYIKQFIKDLNGVSEAGRDMGFISTFMGRYKKAAVAANLRVVVQQPMSYARALAVMDAKYLAAGAKGNLGEAVREMQQYSGIAAWKAMGFFDTNIGRDLTAQIKHDETLADRLSDASMFLAGKADELTWGTLWKACKAETADKGYTGNELLEKTAERFREVVYATQVVDATTTRSHLMRSNSPINKMWTAFMSEPTLTYNMMLDTVLQWHFEKRKGNKPKWRDAVGKNIIKAGEAYVVNAVLLAMATALLDAWRDDDDFETFWEKYKEALGGNILDELNPVTKVVVLKDMWDILIEGGGSDRMDTAFLTQTKKAYDVVTEWFKVKFMGADPTSTTYYGKMGGYGVIYEVLKALGGITGMPFAATSREVVSLWNNTVGALYPNLKAKTYNEKPELGYEKLYEAMVNGDQDLQRQLIDQLHGKGLDDEKIDDGVKAVIKDMFLSGELTEEETADQLIAYCGYDATGTGSNSINYQLDRWSIEDFKMSADMDAAFAAGDGEAAREAVEYMMERYGRTESQIRSDITKYFKDAYINGSADERRRIRSLMLATGLYKADALDKQLAGWLKDKDKDK